MKSTYNGRTIERSDNLFEPSTTTVNKPRKFYKFDVPSLYYDGKYYFPTDIVKRDKAVVSRHRSNKPYEIQVVYYSGKWYQDTHYISEEFKNFLEEHYK
jgi:hypothetical protein